MKASEVLRRDWHGDFLRWLSQRLIVGELDSHIRAFTVAYSVIEERHRAIALAEAEE